MNNNFKKGKLHGITKLISLGLVALSVMLFTVIPASADSVETYKNQKTGYYIGGSNGSQNTFNSIKPVDWSVQHWNDGTVELTVHPKQGGGYALENKEGLGTILNVRSTNQSEEQSWWVIHHDDGTLSFKNQSTGNCIDSSEARGLRATNCYYNDHQRFN